MAVTAEQLNIILSAKDKQFNDALKRSQRQVDFFAKKSQKNLNKTSQSFNALGNAAKRIAPIIATAFGVRAAQNAANMAVQVGRLASISGTTVTEFQKFAAAAKTVGIEQEKASDILKDMNDRVGDFLSTGGGPMKDFFEQVAPLVGVTADQFRNLSGPQSLQLFVDTLQKAGASQQDFTFYLEAMASDATALLPLLQDGARELTRIGDAAENSGRLFKDEAVDGATEFQIKMQELSDKINTEFLNSLVSLEDEIAVLSEFVTDYGVPAFEAMVTAAGATVGAIDMVVTKFRELKGLDGESDLFGSGNVKTLEIELKEMKTRRSAVQNQVANLLDGRDPSELSFMQSQRLSNPLGMGMLDTLTRLNQEIQMTELMLQAMRGEVAGTGSDLFNATGNALQLNIGGPGADRHPPAVPPKGLPNNDPNGTNSAIEIDALKDAYARLLAQLIPANTAQAEYALQVQTINQALEAGLTTREMANTLIERSGLNARRAADEISGMASVTDAFEQGLNSTIAATLQGTESMSKAFENMANDVVRQLFRILVQQQIVNGLMGAFGFSPAPQGGFVKTPKLASGGTVRAGSPVMTGESGRELFVPSQNGRILSPAQSRGALSGGGNDVTVVQNINVTTGVQQTVRAEVLGLMPQIAEASKAAVLDARRRGGSFAGSF